MVWKLTGLFLLLLLILPAGFCFNFFGLLSPQTILVLPADINGEDLNVGTIVASVVDANAVFANFFVARNYIDANFLMNANVNGDLNVSGHFNSVDLNANFVPYIGATKDIDIGSNNLTTTGIGMFGKIQSTTGTASGGSGVAIGASTVASGAYSMATGFATTAKGESSMTAGKGTTAFGSYSFAGGYGEYDGLFSLDKRLWAIGSGSFAYGYADTNLVAGSIAAHKGAIALGYNVKSLNEASVTLGKNLTNYKANSVLVQDLNAMNDVNAGGSVQATAFFGNGSGLTGITFVDTNFQTFADFNRQYYSVYDLNRQFVPYAGATSDLNIGAKNIIVDGNLYVNRVCYNGSACTTYTEYAAGVLSFYVE